MKNKELLEFVSGLNSLRSDLRGRVFTHAVVLNQQNAVSHIKALEEARKPSEEMQKYLDKFEALKREYAKKDGQGNEIIKTANDPRTGMPGRFYDIPDAEDPHSEFTKKRNELYEANKNTIDEHTKMLQEWDKLLLTKDSDYQVKKIDLDDIPNEVSTSEMTFLIHMIND